MRIWRHPITKGDQPQRARTLLQRIEPIQRMSLTLTLMMMKVSFLFDKLAVISSRKVYSN